MGKYGIVEKNSECPKPQKTIQEKRSSRQNSSSRKRGGQESCPDENSQNGGGTTEQVHFMARKKTKVTRNPFLNYVRHIRMERDFRNMKTLLKEAGCEWSSMSNEGKQQYYEEAQSIEAPVHSPPFYKLGEHKLGPSLRKNLAQFKTLIDNAVESNFNKLRENTDK